jgi:hypothetical protein
LALDGRLPRPVTAGPLRQLSRFLHLSSEVVFLATALSLSFALSLSSLCLVLTAWFLAVGPLFLSLSFLFFLFFLAPSYASLIALAVYFVGDAGTFRR